MPYYLVGRKELEENPGIIKKLEQLVLEDEIELYGKKRRHPRQSARRNILDFGLSYIVSTDARGMPKGFLSFKFPRGKQGCIETFRSFTSEPFRSRDRKDGKRRGVGGEATRRFFRLVSIARQKGIGEIYASALDWKMMHSYEKIRDNPRVWLRKGEILKVRELQEALRKMGPKQRRAAGRLPEEVFVTCPKHRDEIGRAAVKIKPRKRPK